MDFNINQIMSAFGRDDLESYRLLKLFGWSRSRFEKNVKAIIADGMFKDTDSCNCEITFQLEATESGYLLKTEHSAAIGTLVFEYIKSDDYTCSDFLGTHIKEGLIYYVREELFFEDDNSFCHYKDYVSTQYWLSYLVEEHESLKRYGLKIKGYNLEVDWPDDDQNRNVELTLEVGYANDVTKLEQGCVLYCVLYDIDGEIIKSQRLTYVPSSLFFGYKVTTNTISKVDTYGIGRIVIYADN